MSGRMLGILALIAVFAIGAAMLVKTGTGPKSATPSAQNETTLVPGLMDKIEAVANIRITDATGSIELVRDSAGAWHDATHDKYPAKAESVGALVLALANQDAGEPKTEDPKLLAELGVEDPAPGPNGTLVELRDSAGATIAAVILGKHSERVAGGRFVRIVGAPRARQITMTLSPSTAMREWINPKIVQIPRDRLASITIEPVDAPAIDIERAGPTSPVFVLRGFDGTLSEDPMGAPAQLTSALAWIDLDAVRLSSGDPPTDAWTTTYRMRDGWSAVIRSWAEGDGRWIRLQIIDPTTMPEGDVGVHLAAELAEMRTTVTGWDFRIPDVRFQTLRPTREALTAPPAPTPPPGAASPAPQN